MNIIKSFFKISAQSNVSSIALLAVRLVVGVAFVIHGWEKILDPFGWMSPWSQVPGFFQFLAALSQFGGGIALITGLLTRLASLGLFITMAYAYVFHITQGHPFIAVGGKPSYEIAAFYTAVSFMFLLIGPGRFSIDAKVFGITLNGGNGR